MKFISVLLFLVIVSYFRFCNSFKHNHKLQIPFASNIKTQIPCSVRSQLLQQKMYPSLLECDDSVKSYAASYISIGKNEEAEKSLVDSLWDKTNRLGENHLDTLEAMNNLGNLYLNYHLKEYGQAEYLFKDCYLKRKEILGENHLDTLKSMKSLAKVYVTLKKYYEAELLYQDIIKLIQTNTTTVFDLKPNRLDILKDIYPVRNYNDKELYYKSCLEISRDLCGEKDPNIISTIEDLVKFYKLYDTDWQIKAESYLKQCVSIRTNYFGKKHPETLKSIDKLLNVYEEIGKYYAAVPLYKECIDIRKNELGESHPDTLLSIENFNKLNKKIVQIREKNRPQ